MGATCKTSMVFWDRPDDYITEADLVFAGGAAEDAQGGGGNDEAAHGKAACLAAAAARMGGLTTAGGENSFEAGCLEVTIFFGVLACKRGGGHIREANGEAVCLTAVIVTFAAVTTR